VLFGSFRSVLTVIVQLNTNIRNFTDVFDLCCRLNLLLVRLILSLRFLRLLFVVVSIDLC
jgi:hypothetical protein